MRFLTYLVFAASLVACGEVSYKRGGDARDIEQAHQACRGSGEAFAACLEKHGWQKPETDMFDPLFATVTASDNRQPAVSKPTSIVEINPETSITSKGATVAKTTKTTDPATIAMTPNVEAAKVAPQSTVNDGPDVEYAINSWWKMGGFPDRLAADEKSCEKKLGPQYLPDYKTQTFKRAFVVCMHDLGWMAVRNVK